MNHIGLVKRLTFASMTLAFAPSLTAQTYLAMDLARNMGTTQVRHFSPTYADYNGDGIDDLIGIVWQDTARLISGANGSILRTYYRPPGVADFRRAIALPDSDGDGLPEIGLGDPTRFWAVRSTAGSGRVDQLSNSFAMSTLYSFNQAVSQNSLLLGLGDSSKIELLDPRTGQVRARLSNGVSTGLLGQSAVNVGDVNRDGIDDFASSGGNVFNPDGSIGNVYILSGAITTSSQDYTPLSSLPPGLVLAKLSGVNGIGSGSAGGWQNTSVSLGDPLPFDGQRQTLIATGAPWTEAQPGSVVAHLLTVNSDGTITTVKTTTNLLAGGGNYGRELVSLGDVNHDGVSDLAVLSEDYPDINARQGLIEVISGAGLLDGFQPADVLQRIEGLPLAFFYGSMHGLGDYDRDGRFELAVSVLYNGENGIYGYRQHIYEVVPEPASLLGLGVGFLALRRNR